MTTFYTLTNPLLAGSAYTLVAFVGSVANTGKFQTSVTLAAGDAKLSKDGAAFANLTNIPVETGTSGMLVITLTTAETTGITKYGIVKLSDAAGGEWQDAVYIAFAQTAVTELDAAVSTIAASVTASGCDPAEGDLTDVVRWTAYSTTLTGMTISAGWTQFWVSFKEDLEDDDDDAIIRILVTNGGAVGDGLQRINKQSITEAGLALTDATLTVDQVAGSVVIYIKHAATAALPVLFPVGYDAKESDGTDPYVLSSGKLNIKNTETRATS